MMSGAALQAASSSGQAVSLYEKEIKPVLKERCYACHGALKQKSDLRVDTAAFLHESGSIVPGKPESSELVRRIQSRDDDERMPPEGHALSKEQIERIVRWISEGAPGPEGERPEDDPLEHWAFQKIRRPEVPEIGEVRHPVDAFLAEKQQEKGITPVRPIERNLALRRLYLNLIGLPPSTDQLRDERPWADIVDELLASPQHGERWARHWMDVWRYSDWYGLGAQLRYSQKHLWHWRDWIVESLNEDVGYDHMVLAMLAGDEIFPANPDEVRATGFLARNYFLFNRTTWLDNTIEHTGKAFLGLTLNCAKCHDHKYDPVSMVDYYRFRALFEPHQVRLDPVPGETDLERNGLPRVFDDDLDAVTRIHLRGDEKQPDEDTEIVAGVPEFLSAFGGAVEEVSLPLAAYAPGSQEWVQNDQLEAARSRWEQAKEKLEQARKEARLKQIKKGGASERTPPASFRSIQEEFETLDEKIWKIEGKGLELKGGKLVQTEASREPARLVSRNPLPENFQLTCRYTTTGGPTYRSVTFRFHRDQEGDNADFVYTSEHTPGPKVQAAYMRNGKTSYPSDGRAAKLPAVGESQELKLAVRGDLVNVWLDGELVLAYRYPDRLAPGTLSVSGFDATVEFDSLEVSLLPDDIELTEAKNRVSKTPADQASALRIAEWEEKAAGAEWKSIEATVAADRYRYRNGDSEDEALSRKASSLQIEAALARAEADLAVAESKNDSKKKKAATEAGKKAEERRLELEEGTVRYEPLRVSRKALETPEHKFSDYPSEFSGRSTGRRTMLARWIVSPENPLTARVAVNHVWMRHFGEPLVDSVFDFGRQAEKPELHALLDYLSIEFIESGWSFRHLHRLLVTSQAWRRATSTAGVDSQTREADPQNRLYWRMNPRRMEAQVIRDSLLHLSGGLDLTPGGPSVDPDGSSKRRSLYFTHSPDNRSLFLSTFDDADLLQCYRRSESVVPQQALALSNSQLAFDASDEIARQLDPGLPEDKLIKELFFKILGRDPSVEELSACRDYLDSFPSEKRERGRAQLILSLLNHNDFVSIR